MVSRTRVPALALLAGLVLPLAAQAQGTSKFTFTPSFRTYGVYDDNLFATDAADRVGSYYLRFTPAFNTGYQGSAFTLNAGYGFDAELYPDQHSELTDPFARQRATLNLGFALTRTAALSFNALYATSNYPSDLIEDTGLESGRRNSQSYRAGVNFSKQLSAQDAWNIGYNASLLDYQGSNNSISHGISTSWSHQYSTLTSTTLAYSYRRYAFGDELTSPLLDGRSSESHLLTFGWTRRLSERTTMTLQLGPRLSDNFVNINASDETIELQTQSAVGADALASVQYSKEKTSLSLAYRRHENQVFSRSGFVNTDSMIMRFGQGLGRSFNFSVSPGAYRNTRGGAETWTYRASVNASQQLASWIHFTATYRYSFQQGRFVNTFGGTIVDGQDIARNVVSVGLTFGHTFEE